MSDSFAGIRDLLRLREGRRQSGRDRLQGSIQGLGNKLFTKKENEAQREFDAGAPGREREAQWAPFEDGPREFTDPATGQTIMVNSPGEMALAQQGLLGSQRLGEIGAQGEEERRNIETRGDVETDLTNLEWDRRGDFLDAETQAIEDRLIDETEISREVYEDGFYADPETGRSYRWNTPEQYGMALRSIDSDRTADRIALQAAANESGEDTSDWLGRFMDLRNDIMADYGAIWNGQMWTGVPDEQLKGNILADFEAAISALPPDQMSDAEKEYHLNRFQEYLNNAQVSEEVPGGSEDGRGLYEDTPVAGGVAENEPGGRLTAPSVAIFEALQQLGESGEGLVGGALQPMAILTSGLWDTAEANQMLKSAGVEVPEGVRDNTIRNETSVWSQLMGLVGGGQLSPDMLGEANRYISELEGEGYIGGDRIDDIEAFLARAMAGSSTTGGL